MRALKTFIAALVIVAALASTTSCKSADTCPSFIGATPTANSAARV
ncbi:MAG: hypothetical protein ACO28T_01335 [Schleiferiaceae bacterium]